MLLIGSSCNITKPIIKCASHFLHGHNLTSVAESQLTLLIGSFPIYSISASVGRSSSAHLIASYKLFLVAARVESDECLAMWLIFFLCICILPATILSIRTEIQGKHHISIYSTCISTRVVHSKDWHWWLCFPLLGEETPLKRLRGYQVIKMESLEQVAESKPHKNIHSPNNLDSDKYFIRRRLTTGSPSKLHSFGTMNYQSTKSPSVSSSKAPIVKPAKEYFLNTSGRKILRRRARTRTVRKVSKKPSNVSIERRRAQSSSEYTTILSTKQPLPSSTKAPTWNPSMKNTWLWL